MSRKWVAEEGVHWVEKGIITQEQYNQILELYPPKKSVTERLPLFAAILIGMGVLTFVASNWPAIPQLIRLTIMIVAMGGFYLFGYREKMRSASSFGTALLALGIITFGAGIFLTGQMFHLTAYDARAFIVWSVPALVLMWMYGERIFYYLSLFILTIGQVYSAVSFGQFSWVLLFFLIGPALYAIAGKRGEMMAMFTASVMLHSFVYIVIEEQAIGWLALIAALMYAASDWLREKSKRIASQLVALASAFFIAVFFVFLLGEIVREPLPHPLFFFSLFIAAFIFSWIGKGRRGERIDAMEWMIFLPFFYWQSFGDVMYLLVLFFFSGYLLWIGQREESSAKVNVGTMLFLLSTCIGYVQIAWSFLPKSIFFFVGGLLLFVLHSFLQRQRRKWFADSGGKGGKRI
jgi:uncharacterized membrane protein